VDVGNKCGNGGRMERREVNRIDAVDKAGSVGIDIGGTFTDVVKFNGDFSHIATFSTAEVLRQPEILVDLLDKLQPSRVTLGVAAWVRGGKILRAPNLPEFKKLEEVVDFQLVNDANCFAFYAAHVTGFSNIFAVTLGTGVGSGIVVNGKLYEGHGLAGEIGHVFAGGNEKCVCGGTGHLEAFFSGWAIKGRFGRELVRDELLNYQGFDVLCREVASTIMILDPECVAFGGRISMMLEEEDFKVGIEKYLMPEFEPEFVVIKDALAIAKGAALLAALGGE
jgi:glucokinase/N-acetylglucosamine kinase